jgi:hypothetical protein
MLDSDGEPQAARQTTADETTIDMISVRRYTHPLRLENSWN